MKHIRLLAAAFLVLASATLAGAGRADPAPQHPSPESLDLRFGVYQTDKATELYRAFLPVLEMLQGDLEKRLERPVDIELKIFKTYEAGLDALVEGDVDFVRFGPASYVLAQERNRDVELLAMESKKGKKTFHGVICVLKNSPYRSLEDLKGSRFAFGDRNSTIGRYLSQAELLDAGITASELKQFRYLGQHDKVGKAVLLGDFDAGALKESTFKKMNEHGALRALHTFDNVTKPWVAREGLPPMVQRSLRFALLEATDADALASLKVSGFLPVTDADYAPVRNAMRRVRAEFEPTERPVH